ncbi:hypothetical protein JXA34_03670 [Patescibacteria group bacterium]|nr:hypothetical protein [Patescibacteria group bacterium]
MTNYIDFIAKLFTVNGAVDVIEFFVFITMVIYTLLAFILTRQVKLMNRSFTTPYAPLFRTLALLHFGASILVATLTLFII